jgi:hypothetical protein
MYSREWMAKMRRKEARRKKQNFAAVQKSKAERKNKTNREAAA